MARPGLALVVALAIHQDLRQQALWCAVGQRRLYDDFRVLLADIGRGRPSHLTEHLAGRGIHHGVGQVAKVQAPPA